MLSINLSSGTVPSEWKVLLITPVYKSADGSVTILLYHFYVLHQKPWNVWFMVRSLIMSLTLFHLINLASFLVGQLFNNCYYFIIIFMMLSLMGTKLMPFIWSTQDLHKAFNSISHSNLLDELREFLINGNLWNCYLSDDMQCVHINGAIIIPTCHFWCAPREYRWHNMFYNYVNLFIYHIFNLSANDTSLRAYYQDDLLCHTCWSIQTLQSTLMHFQ